MNKQLKTILTALTPKSVVGSTDIDVNEIHFDSRKVTNGTAFVAVKGTAVDGHEYIGKAISLGATAVICEEMPGALADGVTYVQVENSGYALGMMASAFHDNPSHKLTLVGITGTNGKTSSVTLLFNLFRELGYNSGLLSTVENRINDDVIPSTHTTPDPVSLNALLARMVAEGCTHCFMEVSSHAIVQERIAGLKFKVAVFSNISHDHLDYHKTFEEYIKAKKKFFDDLGKDAHALVNIDDRRGTIMVQNTKASKHTFALKHMADFKAKILSNTVQGLELDVDGHSVWFKLIGAFNAYNLLSVYGVAVLLEEDPENVLSALSAIGTIRGRFEQVMSTSGITGIIDYAHTPDALQNVISTILALREGNSQLITVTGCGGDRDKTKRPEMARIAAKNSDRLILTSDNPRSEEPEDILKEMQAGIGLSDVRKTLTIMDRKEAIKTACALANPGDVILVAGKGHETYQEIKGVKHPFDDKEVLLNMLEETGN